MESKPKSPKQQADKKSCDLGDYSEHFETQFTPRDVETMRQTITAMAHDDYAASDCEFRRLTGQDIDREGVSVFFALARLYESRSCEMTDSEIAKQRAAIWIENVRGEVSQVN
ncbi:hypothetical protein [Rosistilla oblonga]|uniref:hypothetical protein n=1 Tax=Rosistilla oblonga TaxID=2527990 RepID=UPI003A968DCA